jgi:drug/metabolite transporter (DMT)-like permease
MQLVCGGVVLFAISALTGEFWLFDPGAVTVRSWTALAYLTVAGSVVGFTAYVWLLEHAPAPLVGTYTFVTPIIALLLGWGLLGEHLSTQMLVGMGLVIGSVIVAWRLESGARVNAQPEKSPLLMNGKAMRAAEAAPDPARTSRTRRHWPIPEVARQARRND